MFDYSPSAPDTALSEDATVLGAEPAPIQQQALPAAPPVQTIELADVEITPISPTEWRVADHAIQHDDPTALLGFIQIVGSAFEVTNLGRPRERAYFSSFDRATASLLTRGVLA
jgi:hypothetical protein